MSAAGPGTLGCSTMLLETGDHCPLEYTQHSSTAPSLLLLLMPCRYKGLLCASIPGGCQDARGACCTFNGICRENVTLQQCPLTQSSWNRGGNCSDTTFCVGSCCRNPNRVNAACQDNVKQSTCTGPNNYWSIYGMCSPLTCPVRSRLLAAFRCLSMPKLLNIEQL